MTKDLKFDSKARLANKMVSDQTNSGPTEQ